MNSKCRGRLALFFILCLTLSLSACRFKAPNAVEGEHLAATKTFPGAVPSWIMQSKNSPRQPVETGGIIPQTYSAPTAVQQSALSRPNPQVQSPLQTDEERMREEDSKAKQLGKPGEENKGALQIPAKESSPLDRIMQLCPGVDNAVNDALQTAERNARIQKYEKLSQRCPQSWDIWLWLGKDYEGAGRLVEAGRSYERVLTIDSGNEVAQALLANVRKRQNESSPKK